MVCREGGFGMRDNFKPRDRMADLGSAARPGLRMQLVTASEAERRVNNFLGGIDEKVAVSIFYLIAPYTSFSPIYLSAPYTSFRPMFTTWQFYTIF